MPKRNLRAGMAPAIPPVYAGTPASVLWFIMGHACSFAASA
jgi:hypothetical protein